MNRRPRILLLIPHLGGGGAEQVTTLLARGLSREKYEVHLGLLTQTGAGAVEMPPWVNVHALAVPRVRAGAFRLLGMVRRIKPDLILSGMAHLNFLVLLLRPFFPRGTRVLVRQNATVSAALKFGGLPPYSRTLYWTLYRCADRVICQTRAMAEDLAAELGIREERIAVLANPVDVEAIEVVEGGPIQWTGDGPHLLAVGRLSREKGFDLLLRALETVRNRFPKADLAIAGAGPEEAGLKNQCRKLGLEAAVCFPGYIANPWTYFPGAALFVLASRHEGMPNALLEAAAGGLPIVALPASAGVVDLLHGRPGVWIAAEISSAALASSLLAALEVLPTGARFTHAFVPEFSLESAIRAYEGMIDSTL